MRFTTAFIHTLSNSNKQTRLEWVAALDKIEALNPRAVIAGHKVPENDDDPKNIEETRRYIRDFIRLNELDADCARTLRQDARSVSQSR